ncbi:hypothetical protein CDV31_013247 [Fusarium ambrosium]|uniref:Uncharacterized protein n=1 Tax=Fusarium ambrosium TaxID=131363 RepID=A0A428T4L8_9HYPO|nr:hypothetical protein CDV31_013247 [Fusarium ambrosium]
MPSKKDTINPPGPPPPRPPPNLLTMVKLVFSIRVKTVLRQREEAHDRRVAEYYRLQDEEDAKIAVKPIREAAREMDEAREAMLRMLEKPTPYIYRRPELDPIEKLTWTEIDRFMDDEVEKEVTVGLGLKRAEGETWKGYCQRMTDLESRLDGWISIEYFRQQNGPLRYMDGMPVSLIAVHRHVRPIKPPKPTKRWPCLQCKARGLPCSRTLNFSYGPAASRSPTKEDCSRCKRNGDRCLTMWDWLDVEGDYDPTCWRYTHGSREGQLECAKMWMARIEESKRILPLPKWHENDRPENVGDDEYQPKGWWNVLKDGLTEW